MLSDEEKEAIEELKTNATYNYYGDSYLRYDKREIEKIIFPVLSLIEKQQKEIEELKNEVMEKELIIDGMKEDRRIAVEEIQEQYYVSKDKIKAKIEESELLIDNSQGCMSNEDLYKEYGKIEFGQSLLEKE